MKLRLSALFACLSFTIVVFDASAQAPRLINFQAQVEGVTSGTVPVGFAIYDVATGGTALWSESYSNLAVQNGRIQVLLGSATNGGIPANVFESDGDRFIAITVNNETLSPRSRLSSVAYALRAAIADQVAGGGGGGITTINAGNGITVSDNDGPTTEIGLEANAITDAYIQDESIGASSLAPGSVGESEMQSNSVGTDELKNQIKLGANGKLEIGGSSNQTVVVLETQANTVGLITALNTQGNNGARIWGDLTSANFFGGSMATFKRDGANSSIWLRTEGTSAANAWGVVGVSNAANVSTIELNGENGDVSIAGNLSKGSGSFKIDHPLDPANKYLSHSFVESPDMMNIYNGNVILNDEGEAWVELPEWFEALNRDFRYQLTCIGGQALVYVEEEISGNQFKIAGGTSGLKVSWQVTGVRQDPYAEAHRIKVEEEKPAAKRGSYLHPEANRVRSPESGVRGQDNRRN